MAEKTKKEETTQTFPNINFSGTPDSIIPKLCTGIFFQIAGEKLILTLSYHEGNDLQPKQVNVIARAALDLPLAKSALESLQKAIEDFEKNREQKKEEAK